MRWRYAFAVAVALFVADLVTKLHAPDGWAYQVGPQHWEIIDNPHKGAAMFPEWIDLVLVAFIIWPVTRLAALVVAAGSVGNMVWSWTGGVPNVFLSNRADGTGWLDLLWPADPMTAYNVADLCLSYGLRAVMACVVVWAVRSLYALAQVRTPRVPRVPPVGGAGTPAGAALRDRLGAGRRYPEAFPRRA